MGIFSFGGKKKKSKGKDKKGKEADKYLGQQNLAPGTLDKMDWTKDSGVADKVAAAVLAWAKDHGNARVTEGQQQVLLEHTHT